MSNPLAIAAVTATLQNMLLPEVVEGLPPALVTDLNLGTVDVTTKPLDKARVDKTGHQINLFLYQTTPNAAFRNTDPTQQDNNGQPPTALDLHYLVTVYGEADDDIPAQVLLGQTLRIFHDNAVLARNDIQEALVGNDLFEQVERVRLTTEILSNEELSKLWTTFKTEYRLSAAIGASVVLIDSRKPVGAPLPVLQQAVHITPFKRPWVGQVTPQIAAPSGLLTLEGQDLAGTTTRVVFDGQMLVEPDTISDWQIATTLPSDLAVGIHTVQIVHLLDVESGDPSEPRRGAESNLVAFALAPQITSTLPITGAPGGLLTLEFTPPVERKQRVALFVGDRTISIPTRPDSDPPNTTSFDFPIPADFPAGEYLLRLRVDGADSPLMVDDDSASPTFNQYIGPKAKIA